MNRVIAVIDDDLPSVEMLVKFLRDAGHTVHFFYDGLSGFQYAKEHKPDLVICDMLLPKLHGLDVCRKIKADPSLHEVTVILMTAVYRDARYRKEVEAVGANGFFTKPFELQKVMERIQRVLGARFTGSHPDVKKEIEAVGKDYAAGLPERIDELDVLW